jgi:FixJ family two-component response regulator
MCSALGQNNLQQKTMAAGALDFIVKPFKKEDFIKRINRALSC